MHCTEVFSSVSLINVIVLKWSHKINLVYTIYYTLDLYYKKCTKGGCHRVERSFTVLDLSDLTLIHLSLRRLYRLLGMENRLVGEQEGWIRISQPLYCPFYIFFLKKKGKRIREYNCHTEGAHGCDILISHFYIISWDQKPELSYLSISTLSTVYTVQYTILILT